MAEEKIYICSMGAVTPVGLNTKQTAAAIRAGLSNNEESSICNKYFEPFVLSLLPENLLPELNEKLKNDFGLTSKQVRMLRIATPAIREALSPCNDTGHIPLILAGPEPLPERNPAIANGFIQLLIQQTGIELDAANSEIVPLGRSAGLVALEKAINLITNGAQTVLVGGVDTYLDLYLLAAMDAENRILGQRVMDGFIPGEAAAFILISKEPLDEHQSICVAAAAHGFEKGHLYSDEPYKGEGLADTLQILFDKISDPKKIRTVFAGLNGENFWAKEWGVASLRNAAFIDPDARFEHPADCIGDPGAALGVLLIILSAMGMQKNYYAGPCMAWCSSDYGTRAAAVVDII